MIIFLSKSDRDYSPLLSDTGAVKGFLRERVDEPWVEWLDFSTAERFNDDPLVSDLIGDREGIVVWRFKTTDGVHAYVVIDLESVNRAIRVNCKLEEPEGMTLWRYFRPWLDAKLDEIGIDLSEARTPKEHQDMLKSKLREYTEREKQTRTRPRS